MDVGGTLKNTQGSLFPQENKITSEHKEDASMAWCAAEFVIITSKSNSE